MKDSLIYLRMRFRASVRSLSTWGKGTFTHKKRGIYKLAFLLGLTSAITLAVPWAQARQEVTDRCPVEHVCMNGHSIFTVKGKYGNDYRSEHINDRLNALISDRSIKPESLKITKWDSYITISTNRETLVTFRAEDFRNQGIVSEADKDRLVRDYLARIKHWLQRTRAEKDLKFSFGLFFLTLSLAVIGTFTARQKGIPMGQRFSIQVLAGKIVEFFLLFIISFFSINLLLLFVEAVFDYLPSNLLIHSNTVLLMTQISEILYVIALIVLSGIIYLTIQ